MNETVERVDREGACVGARSSSEGALLERFAYRSSLDDREWMVWVALDEIASAVFFNSEMEFDGNFSDNDTDYPPVDIPFELFGPKRDSLYIVIPITILYVVIFFTGLIGNVSTCVVIAKNKFMHTATNYYLFSLAISDLLLLVFGLPQEMYQIWSRYPYVFGYAFCILRGLVAETSANATVLTITAFTVERYVAICHPFLSHTMAKLSRVVKLIIVTWIVAICFAIPQAFQFEIYRPIDDNPETAVCQPVRPIIAHSFEVSTFLFFCAPMTLITVLYVLIGLRLKSSTNMLKRESMESKKSVGNTYSSRRASRNSTNQSSKRVLKMLVAVVVAFFICWAPFHAQRLFAIYVTPSNDGSENRKIYLMIYEIMTYVSGVLYYLSTCVNPLLYNIMSNKFREAFKETFTRCCCMSRNTRPQRTYSVLSRSAQRGPDSTDSGRECPSLHTNTTMIHKNSLESSASFYTGRSRLNRRSFERPSSADTEKSLVTFSWKRSRSDIRITMAPKCNYENIEPNTKLVAVQVTTQPKKLNKFVQLFQCLAKKTLDDGKKFTSIQSPTRDVNICPEIEKDNKLESCSIKSGDISNSSLKNVDGYALRDELSTYVYDGR